MLGNFWRKTGSARTLQKDQRPRARQTFRPRLESLESRSMMAVVSGGVYLQTNLVSDQANVAAIRDANLVNPWGIALSPTTGNFWVADNGTSVSSLYGGNVSQAALTKNSLQVTVPGGSITGVAFNSTTDFVISDGNGHSGAATFIFASEGGKISGWNANVPPPATSTAALTGATSATAVYKGLAIGNNGTENLIYAANFHDATIDVYDTTFATKTLVGTFTDPNLPAGYAPYNVQNIGGTLYVTYAKQDAQQHDEVKGAGNGFVDKFDTNGNFLSRFVTQGALNAPWGVVQAPSTFGKYGNDILVANFGDGKINAYNATTGALDGTLTNPQGAPIIIDGLRGLAFGNGVTAGDTNALYFTAGAHGETHGLFGKLVAGTDVTSVVSKTAPTNHFDFFHKVHRNHTVLQLQNTTSTLITGPITVIFSNLPKGIKITNPTGYTAAGDPYITITGGILANKTRSVDIRYNSGFIAYLTHGRGAFKAGIVVQGQFG